MKDKATIGLIGLGGIAQNQHLPNLTRAPHVSLKAVCDLRPDVLGQMQKKYNIPVATTNHRELLADPEIDAVVIATREEAHAVLAIEAMEAGKHVYVEKPLGRTPEECGQVVEAQRKTDKFAAVGHNRRMAPAYRKASEILRANGGAKNIHYRISDHYFIWGKQFQPGMRVVHEVCHIFDILRYLTESEVRSVYSVGSRADDEAFTLKFASGCVATIMSSGYVWHDMPKESLEVIADLGGLIVTDFCELETFGLPECAPRYCFEGHTHPDRDAMHQFLLAKQGAQSMKDLRRVQWESMRRMEELRQTAPDSLEYRQLANYVGHHAPISNYMVDKGWLAAVEHFAKCVLAGKLTELATVEDGWQASLITAAAIRSRESGEVVRL